MKKIVKILPSGMEFEAVVDTSVLESALVENVVLEHSCLNGSCGVCKARLIKGEIDFFDPKNKIPNEEKSQGYFLSCQSKPLSSIEIEADYYPELSDLQRMVTPAKVNNIEFVAEDVVIVKLRLPPKGSMKFLAGQYFDLIIGGTRRSYSAASSSSNTQEIEMHIRKVQNGEMSSKIFNDLKLESLVRLDGPQGSFFVRESARPIIFLAGGTGFAPVKAMVESLIESNDTREIKIFWGASTHSGFYSQMPFKWASERGNIEYIPVLSGVDSSWSGEEGLVHKAVLKLVDNLLDYDVYACGSQVMIDAASNDFQKKGHDPKYFYSDAFVPAN